MEILDNVREDKGTFGEYMGNTSGGLSRRRSQRSSLTLEKIGPVIELVNEPIDFIDLSVDLFPVFREIMPLRIQFGKILALLLNPGEVFQVVDSTLIIITEFTHVGGRFCHEIAVIVLCRLYP